MYITCITFSKKKNCWKVYSTVTYLAEDDFLKNDIRVNPNLDSLGALGDIGWYCIHAILWVHDYEFPNTVTAFGNPEYHDSGVILSCGACLNWKTDGKVATFCCSFLSNLCMDIIALGTKGNFLDNSKWAERAVGCGPEPGVFKIATDMPRERLMIQEFGRLVAGIRSGEPKENKWPIISRKTQLIIDAVVASIKNGFVPVKVVY
ncbi:hypothetical protein Hanom_Chr04g00321331 [Helianthus anomalus]